MPGIDTDETPEADMAPDQEAPETTAEADFATDPAEEATAAPQKAAPDDSAAKDGPKAPEADAAAQAKALAVAEAEKALAEKIAAEKIAAAARMPEEGQPDPLVETQDHVRHPSRLHPASRPCRAGP